MIWISLALTIAILFSAGFYTFFFARVQYDPSVPTYNYLAITAYILWGFTALVALSVLCCYNAIKLGIAVFKTTA